MHTNLVICIIILDFTIIAGCVFIARVRLRRRTSRTSSR